jgi:hypothetical protein
MSIQTKRATVVIAALAILTVVRIVRVVTVPASSSGVEPRLGVVSALFDFVTWSGLTVLFMNWLARRSLRPPTAER